MHYKAIFILLVLLMSSCKDKPKTNEDKVQTQTSILAEGKRLMETKCYLCHSPSAPDNAQRIAPPMVAIKARYLEFYKDKKSFVDGMLDFVNEPSDDKVKLWGAARRYGIMPYQQFSEQEIRKIAGYMYEHQIEEPDWFKEHWQGRWGGSEYNPGKMDSLPTAKKDYKDIGLNYALETKKVLGKNLMGTIQNKGVSAAVAFCNERAYPLTDSMSNQYNAKIKRVSDKPRNPNNKANARELAHINTFKKEVAEGNSIDPIVEEENGMVNFYYPILTNNMCLNCHGTPGQTIPLDVMGQLSQLYPEDKATGYNVNEVRGIWSIVFETDTPE